VIHGSDKDLLTAALAFAASAGVSVPTAVAGRRTEAVAVVVAALAAWTLLEEALARLLFLALVVGGGRLRGSTVRRCAIDGRAILRRSAVLLPFALTAAFIAAAAAAAMSLPLTLPLWVSLRVLTLRRSILGLRLYGSLRLGGRGRVYFCCHSCTSWCISAVTIFLLAPVFLATD
jgi:hypothetical protein